MFEPGIGLKKERKTGVVMRRGQSFRKQLRLQISFQPWRVVLVLVLVQIVAVTPSVLALTPLKLRLVPTIGTTIMSLAPRNNVETMVPKPSKSLVRSRDTCRQSSVLTCPVGSVAASACPRKTNVLEVESRRSEMTTVPWTLAAGTMSSKSLN